MYTEVLEDRKNSRHFPRRSRVAAETYAADMPLRFSSKWFDAETGLGYWGYRWYHTRLGRWLSRDPIGEAGGINLAESMRNDAVNNTDLIGLITCQTSQPRIRRCPEGNLGCQGVCVGLKANGGGSCHEGRPCACVCEDSIRSTYGMNGGPKAAELIIRCVEVEEIAELADVTECEYLPRRPVSDDACLPDIANLRCLKKAIRECDSDRCRKMLIAYAIEQKEQCEHYGTPRATERYRNVPPCSEVNKKACLAAFEDFIREALP